MHIRSGAHACMYTPFIPPREGKIFLIVRDSYLMGVMLEVIGAMMKNQMLTVWSHNFNTLQRQQLENFILKGAYVGVDISAGKFSPTN